MTFSVVWCAPGEKTAADFGIPYRDHASLAMALLKHDVYICSLGKPLGDTSAPSSLLGPPLRLFHEACMLAARFKLDLKRGATRARVAAAPSPAVCASCDLPPEKARSMARPGVRAGALASSALDPFRRPGRREKRSRRICATGAATKGSTCGSGSTPGNQARGDNTRARLAAAARISRVERAWRGVGRSAPSCRPYRSDLATAASSNSPPLVRRG